MEQSAEVYEPSRLCLRIGWAALVCCLLCGAATWHYPLAFVPACALSFISGGLFWLGTRPVVRVLVNQFSIDERAIAWREVREINICLSWPLVVRIHLTNSRRKTLIFPAKREKIARLMYHLRRHSYLATFDGVAYRDFWTWSSLGSGSRDRSVLEQPVRMISAEDEEEVERMFHKLKSVGRLDSVRDNLFRDNSTAE